MGESLFVGLLGFFLAGCVTLILRLQNISSSMKQDFLNYNLHADGVARQTIRELETNVSSAVAVQHYYLHAERLHAWFGNGMIFCVCIALLGIVPYTVKPSDCISSTLLEVWKVSNLVIAALWLLACAFQLAGATKARNSYRPYLARAAGTPAAAAPGPGAPAA